MTAHNASAKTLGGRAASSGGEGGADEGVGNSESSTADVGVSPSKAVDDDSSGTRTPRVSFMSLPPELLDFVLSEENFPVWECADLSSLSLVCRAFFQRVRPRRWKHLEVRLAVGPASTPYTTPFPGHAAKVEHLTQNPHLGALVQDLHFIVECIYEEGFDDEDLACQDLASWREYLFPIPSLFRDLVDGEEGWSADPTVVGALASRSVDADDFALAVFSACPSLRSLEIQEILPGRPVIPFATLSSTPLPYLKRLKAPYYPDFDLYPSLESFDIGDATDARPLFSAATASPPAASLIDIYHHAGRFVEDTEAAEFLSWLFRHNYRQMRTLKICLSLPFLLALPGDRHPLVALTTLHLFLLDDDPLDLPPGGVDFSALFPALQTLVIFISPREAPLSPPRVQDTVLGHLTSTLSGLSVKAGDFAPTFLLEVLSPQYTPGLRRLNFDYTREMSEGWLEAEGKDVVQRCEERGVELSFDRPW
ncbi:hypothetical protein JCM10213_003371 [Rhodosporidiobolus nylandii]